jgi:hypothetical protein
VLVVSFIAIGISSLISYFIVGGVAFVLQRWIRTNMARIVFIITTNIFLCILGKRTSELLIGLPWLLFLGYADFHYWWPFTPLYGLRPSKMR